MIRVLIADDHAVVRQGLRTFLDLQDGLRGRRRGRRRRGGGRRGASGRARRGAARPGDAGARRGRARSGSASGCRRASARADELRRGRPAVPGVRAGAAGFLLKDIEPRSSYARSAPRTRARRRSPAVATRLIEEFSAGGARGAAGCFGISLAPSKGFSLTFNGGSETGQPATQLLLPSRRCSILLSSRSRISQRWPSWSVRRRKWLTGSTAFSHSHIGGG